MAQTLDSPLTAFEINYFCATNYIHNSRWITRVFADSDYATKLYPRLYFLLMISPAVVLIYISYGSLL